MDVTVTASNDRKLKFFHRNYKRCNTVSGSYLSFWMVLSHSSFEPLTSLLLHGK